MSKFVCVLHKSSMPGFIAHLKVSPTNHIYRDKTVFVYHHSDISNVYLQIRVIFNDTVQSKNILGIQKSKLYEGQKV